MFKRILYDNWTHIVPMISFWITFSIFLGISLRAFLMRKKDIRRMSQLPLDEN